MNAGLFFVDDDVDDDIAINIDMYVFIDVGDDDDVLVNDVVVAGPIRSDVRKKAKRIIVTEGSSF